MAQQQKQPGLSESMYSTQAQCDYIDLSECRDYEECVSVIGEHIRALDI